MIPYSELTETQKAKLEWAWRKVNERMADYIEEGYTMNDAHREAYADCNAALLWAEREIKEKK